MDFRVVPLGDSCLSVVFDEKIDPAINDRCVGIAKALANEPDIREVVPAYQAVAVYFDPMRTNRQSLMARLAQAAAADAAPAITESRLPVEVPVQYGGAAGPDIASVADFGACSEAEVVRLHTAPEYRVYMLGFLPGFAYLGSVDGRIAMPRLDTPRLRVPAGSVGIAGIQTGIYPCESPGGWRIIGRTAVTTFDPAKSDPFLFKPGQRVKFVAA